MSRTESLMVQENNGITRGISGKDGIRTQGEEIPLSYFQGKKTKFTYSTNMFSFHPFIKKGFSLICRVQLTPVKIQVRFFKRW